MDKLNILITGATGNIGQSILKMLLKEDQINIKVFAIDSEKERKILKPFLKQKKFEVIYGDIRVWPDVVKAVKGVDLIIHLAGIVSPLADHYPELAFDVNTIGTAFLAGAAKESIKNPIFIHAGSVAQYGDRSYPNHWIKVGDPLSNENKDTYAVSKTSAEYMLIELNLPKWVSLRFSGVIHPGIVKIEDPITTHTPLHGVMEYVSDRDLAILFRNLCLGILNHSIEDSFWNRCYNVGGGESCRISTMELYSNAFKLFGIDNMDGALSPKWFATQNFHGGYFLDSQELNNYLDFQNDSIDYFYEVFEKAYSGVIKLGKIISKLPLGKKLIKDFVSYYFRKYASKSGGTLYALKNNDKDAINKFWGSYEDWKKLPEKMSEYPVPKILKDVKTPQINNKLSLEEIVNLRGGKLTEDNEIKMTFECQNDHKFTISKKDLLNGHWCPICLKELDNEKYKELEWIDLRSF